MRFPQLLQLRLLLWKSHKTETRKSWGLVLLLAYLSLLLTVLWLVIYGHVLGNTVQRVAALERPSEPQGTETRQGFRLRASDVVNWNCPIPNDKSPECEEKRLKMVQFCDYHACFQQEIGLGSYKQYMSIRNFTDNCFSGRLVRPDIIFEQSPEFSFASEEFERERPVPYHPGISTHRFFAAVLRMLAQKVGIMTNLPNVNISLYNPPAVNDTTSLVMFDTSEFATRMIVYVLVLFLPVIPALNLASTLGDEKKSGMKEYLHAMGFSRLVYLSHLIIVVMVKNLPFIILTAAFIFYPNIKFTLLFGMTLFLYYLSCFALTILVSVIIRNQKVIPDVLFIALPVLVLFPLFIRVTRTDVFLSTLSCINPGYALFNALDSLRECSLKGGHLVWFAEFPYVLTFGVTLLMQLLDTVVLVIVAATFDYYTSTSFNPAKWLARYRKVSVEDNRDIDVHEEAEHYHGMDVAIELADLHKTWNSGERAVRGVNMNVYKGQITMLLGQNGAGKSTTFDMITGITLPTSGSIKIDGLASDERRFNYETIGLCPQYNPFFPMLTLTEHLYFFSRLSSGLWDTKEPEEFINLLKLMDHRDKYAKNLSGGNRRKMCIAMALIGDNNIVLLDEPSAGVDLESRMIIQEFLIKKKSEKTLLITTHYTDEAAALGDRICIMANGRIACSGTQEFLNEKFTTGYHCACVVGEKIMLESVADRTLKLAQAYVPATLLGCHGEEFVLRLPNNDSERLGSFLRELDNSKEKMGISQYGMSTAHLEDVFIKVAEQTGSTTERSKVDYAVREFFEENNHRVSSWRLVLYSLFAMFYKRLWFEWRNKFYQFMFLLLVTLSVSLGNIGQTAAQPPEIDMLKLKECGRLLFSNATDLMEKISRIASDRGECLVVRAVNNVTEYVRSNHFSRPPIIGAIERNENGISIALATNRKVFEPKISVFLYEALADTTFDVHLGYQPQPNHKIDPAILGYIKMFVLFELMVCAMSRFVRAYVIEAEKGYAHLQVLTGVSPYLYWIGHFIADSILYALFYLYCGFVCWYFEFYPDLFTNLLGEMVLCFYITLVQIAILHRLFTSKNTANSTVSSILMMLPVLLGVVYWKIQDTPATFSLEKSFPLFLNPFLVVFIYQIQIPLNGPSIFGILIGQLVFFLFIFIALESRTLKRAIMRTINHTRGERRQQNTREHTGGDIEMQPLSNRSKAEDDMGVEANPNGARNIVLEVDNVKKSYNKKTMAVRGLTFGVDQNECFGILGHNGAGKSTIFKILTGTIFADSGEATVSGVDCTKPANIGYCPQDDALTNQLTGKEHLVVLAALHGFAHPFKVADILLRCVGMDPNSSKRFKDLSGGQKRKLSVIASILATSKLIILDEPTASIDAMVRNDIWNLLNSIRDSTNTAIVLTSHSMSEIEALCSRLAIMRQGLIVAHGTPQTLKSMYGDYMKLLLRVPSKTLFGRPAPADEITSVVVKMIPTAVFCSQNLASYTYKIPRLHNDLYSELFELASNVAKALDASTFSLIQSNLEDTFLALSE